MNILISVASKHGSTYEIAEAIAAELQEAGHAATVREAKEASVTEKEDAVLIGSAVYAGNWMPEARQFVERNRDELAEIPVWLFSSGPLGEEDPQPKGDLVGLKELVQQTGARDHKIFVGRLDQARLGLGERIIVRAVKAPYGDFRDWEAVRAWGREIARALREEE